MLPKPPLYAAPLSLEQSAKIGRARKARNWAILGVLIGLVVLFYVVSILKLSGH